MAFVKLKYLDTRKRSKKLCHELAEAQAERSGWECRSYKQVQHFLAGLPPAVVLRMRKGSKAFDDQAAAHITRDYSGLRSNEVWCGDHHQFDVVVMHEGRPVRPWLTAFQDVRSRKLVGWTITPAAGNTDTILAALAAGIDSHGVPEEAYVDNGKDYDSAALQGRTKRQRAAGRRRADGPPDVDANAVAGVFGELGVKVTHARPYNAKAKPIERAFGTVCGRFSKLQATYCGNTPANRPEELAAKLGRNVAPTLAAFTADFAAWVEGDYHARGHTGDAMDGRTPAAVFDACLTVKRTAPAEVRRLLLWKPGPLTKVTKNGVRVGKIGYGAADLALFAWIDRDVIARVDPADVGRAAVCEPSGKLIAFVSSNRKLPFKSTPAELREAEAANRRQQKLWREYQQQRPRMQDDAADHLYRQRAERDAAARAANPSPAPTLAPIVTPLNEQLLALRQALDATGTDGPRPARAGIDLYGADAGPAPSAADHRRFMREYDERCQRDRERADAEARTVNDGMSFTQLMRLAEQQRKAADDE